MKENETVNEPSATQAENAAPPRAYHVVSASGTYHADPVTMVAHHAADCDELCGPPAVNSTDPPLFVNVEWRVKVTSPRGNVGMDVTTTPKLMMGDVLVELPSSTDVFNLGRPVDVESVREDTGEAGEDEDGGT